MYICIFNKIVGIHVSRAYFLNICFTYIYIYIDIPIQSPPTSIAPTLKLVKNEPNRPPHLSDVIVVIGECETQCHNVRK